jgi:hypothetical protein
MERRLRVFGKGIPPAKAVPWKCEFGKDSMCSACGYATNRPDNLRRHLERHTPTSKRRRYLCQECPTSFAFFSDLKQHSKLHCKSAFACPICGHKFITMARMQRHFTFCQKRQVLGRSAVPRSAASRTAVSRSAAPSSAAPSSAASLTASPSSATPRSAAARSAAAQSSAAAPSFAVPFKPSTAIPTTALYTRHSQRLLLKRQSINTSSGKQKRQRCVSVTCSHVIDAHAPATPLTAAAEPLEAPLVDAALLLDALKTKEFLEHEQEAKAAAYLHFV